MISFPVPPSRRSLAARVRHVNDWLALPAGGLGLLGAGVLLGGKAAALLAGEAVALVPVAANLALLGGSAMLVRQGRLARRRAQAERAQHADADRTAV